MKEIMSMTKDGCIRAHNIGGTDYVDITQADADEIMTALERENEGNYLKTSMGLIIVCNDLGFFCFKPE